MINFFRLFIPLLFLFVGSASAETKSDKCTDDIYATVGQELNINLFGRNGNVVSESCKTWPNNNNIFLAAFAYGVGDQNLEDPNMAVFVAMIDKKTKSIISSYQTEVEQDALTVFGEGSLWLDTARYQLEKNVRAFGLQFNSVGVSPPCAEAGWNDELVLLVPEDKKLRVVFDFFKRQQKSISGVCGVDSHAQEAAITFSIEKTSTNGFRDLLATAKITTIGNTIEHLEHYVLRYDGKTYKTGTDHPWWLNTFGLTAFSRD